MINLLPPTDKAALLYARRNTQLLHWLVAIIMGLGGVLVLVGAGQLYLNQAANAHAQEVERTTQQLKAQKLDETQKRVTDISASLKLMVQVLSKQVLFSDLIRQIGAAIPPGAALADLRISKLEGGIDLQFKATDYQTATQVQVNLQDPNNRIFDKADIVSISCTTPTTSNSSSQADSRYPCTVTIRALFSKNNPFLFISPERKEVNS